MIIQITIAFLYRFKGILNGRLIIIVIDFINFDIILIELFGILSYLTIHSHFMSNNAFFWAFYDVIIYYVLAHLYFTCGRGIS